MEKVRTESLLRRMFSPRGRVGRWFYFGWGIILAGLKFTLDRTLALCLLGEYWLPTFYFFLPRNQTVSSLVADNPAFALLLGIVSLPFLWVGFCLTLKRVRAAGLPQPLAFLFFLPLANVLFFLTLSMMPSVSEEPGRGDEDLVVPSPFRGVLPNRFLSETLTAFVLATLFAVGMVGFSAQFLETYGIGLFIGVPFVTAFIAAALSSSRHSSSMWQAISLGVSVVMFSALVVLLFLWEGIICIAMALPLGLVAGAMGGLMGWLVTRPLDSKRRVFICSVSPMVLVLGLYGEARLDANKERIIPVVSEITIDAPRELVWRHVVEFSELPAPKELLFMTGIAYPVRARIEGRGVGAIRYCEFSTGPFVEPIEVWNEPELLRFGVSSMPPPMQEWSVFAHISPAHLHHYFRSVRGQFELLELPGGATRLIGTTWYTHRIAPSSYWAFFSNAIVHTIHGRVLDHIKRESEREYRGLVK